MHSARKQLKHHRISRRKLLLYGGLSFSSLALSAGGRVTRTTTAEQELVQVGIEINNLPSPFVGYRIGFISDMHVGQSVPIDWLDQAITTLNRERIDLLLLGGDYVWLPESLLNQVIPLIRNPELSGLSKFEQLERAYAMVVATLKRARTNDGIFAVPGNHDNWYSPSLCREIMQNRGINLLINQKITINRADSRLELIGFDDYWTGRPALPILPLKKNNRELRVILSHNPDLLSYLLNYSRFEFDLGLSGHTHGGQIRLPGLGALHYGIKDRRLAEGLFQAANSFIYTTRGLGVSGIPIRINCPAEITVLTLKNGSQSEKNS